MTPEPVVDLGDSLEDRAEFAQQLSDLLACLDEIFEDPGLTSLRLSKRPHPAVRLYDHISHYIQIKQFPFEDEREYVASVMTLMLDQATWAIPGRTRTILDQIEDPEARRYVARTVREVLKFDDIMAELTFWGWLRQAGFTAKLLEASGLPDIVVDGPRQFWAEVKRISTDDNPRRARDVIKKANKQLKNASLDAAGVLFLHVRRVSLTPMSDEVPPDVQPFVDEAMRELGAQQSRSVSHVFVMWDDAAMRDNRDGFYCQYVARRQCVVLKHKHPRAELPIDPEAIRIGSTVLLTVFYPARKALTVSALTNQAVAVSAPSAIDFTEQFFTDNAFPEGVRRDRAAEGLRNPDALAAFEFDDRRVLLATRSITSDRSSYITLVVASQIGNGVVAISGAFKVFGSQSELDDIRKDPLKAFTTLIDRYGLEIQLCGFQGEFFPAVTAEIPEGESVPIIGVPQEQSLSMCVLGQRVDSGPSHIVRFVWVYAIKTDDYRRAVRARRP